MKKTGFLVTLLIILGIAIFTWWNYYKEYGNGERNGILTKFSQKGNIFKTYEGEMILPGLKGGNSGGINSNNFYFSVSDQKIADSLNKVVGKSVRVHYRQFLKSMPWRGDNYNDKNSETGQYIVDEIKEVSNTSPNIGF